MVYHIYVLYLVVANYQYFVIINISSFYSPCSLSYIMCIEHMIYFPVYLLCLSCLCIVRFSFLDSRTFVTCSDDTTVCLWDARYLKHKIRTLQGHSNWVKNIEYSSSEDLLLTSGFDGSIYTWDINRYDTEIAINFKSFIFVHRHHGYYQ